MSTLNIINTIPGKYGITEKKKSELELKRPTVVKITFIF